MTITVLNTGPVKRCGCGCGQPTTPYSFTNTRLGRVRGVTYHDFVKGHHNTPGPKPDALARRRRRIAEVHELQAKEPKLTYREIAGRLGTTPSALYALMSDPDGSKNRMHAARHRERHREEYRRDNKLRKRRYRAEARREKLLDGPKFVKWLADQSITLASVWADGEPDNERRLRSWANGQNVRLATADRFLTDHGHHLHQIPDSLWV